MTRSMATECISKPLKQPPLILTLSYGDGRVYEGYWIYGKQHGEGFYTNKDGEKKRGQWEKGKRVKWISK